MIGQTVSHFEILERLGQGGMGVVYKARDLRLDRLVALKFLPPHLGGEDAAERRFLREARTASALDHANICTIYEIGETEDGRTFIAMAYCEGETLAERIARGPVSVEEAVRIGTKVAQGLAEAHARGIVHRDIKPGNIAITKEGAVKILDFGLAMVPGAARITQGDTTTGTAAYMSPEQVRGDPVDPRTDIWSWGVVMYEMLTGQPPFRGDNVPAVIFSILKGDPKPISSTSPVPRTLEAIVEKALSKDPSSRYRSAENLLADLPATRVAHGDHARYGTAGGRGRANLASSPVAGRRPDSVDCFGRRLGRLALQADFLEHEARRFVLERRRLAVSLSRQRPVPLPR